MLTSYKHTRTKLHVKEENSMVTHEEAVARRIEEKHMSPEDCLDRAVQLIAWVQEDCEFDGYVDAHELNKWVGRAVAYVKAAREIMKEVS